MRNGGVESALMSYYKYIDRTKIQYDIFADEDSTHIPEQEIKDLGGRLFIIPPYQKQAAYQRTLHKIFTENKYPLVFSHINSLSVFPLFAAYAAGVPVRVALSQSTAGRGEFKRNIMKYILREFSRIFPTHMCACSRLAGSWLFGRRAMNSGRVLIWPNAIELERYAYNPEAREDMRRYLKLDGKFIVGHSGRFMNQKNHDFLIDIFAEIHRMRRDAVLLLAGDGPLMDRIEAKIMRMGLNEYVIFAGNVHDMERYYQAMDVFVFPSLYEGLGIVAVEAQVSGLPVICSDELPEEAKVCENLRFMSLKRSAEDWAREALKMCEGHIRRDMSINARVHRYDIKEQGAKMSEWYCELLGI